MEHVPSFLQIAVKAGLPIMLPSWVGHIWDTATLTDRVFHATDGNMVRQGEGRGTVSFEGRKDEGMGRSREGREWNDKYICGRGIGVEMRRLGEIMS